jgi:hypothetical protein
MMDEDEGDLEGGPLGWEDSIKEDEEDREGGWERELEGPEGGGWEDSIKEDEEDREGGWERESDSIGSSTSYKQER